MIPGAVIYINTDVSDNVLAVVAKQLIILEVMTAAEFDARYIADPNYPTIIKNTNQRILVKRDLLDFTNRDVADIVIHVKFNLATVELTKYGPPNKTYPIFKLYMQDIIS
jgi:hypothetical protein